MHMREHVPDIDWSCCCFLECGGESILRVNMASHWAKVGSLCNAEPRDVSTVSA